MVVPMAPEAIGGECVTPLVIGWLAGKYFLQHGIQNSPSDTREADRFLPIEEKEELKWGISYTIPLRDLGHHNLA